MTHTNELPLPPDVSNENEAVELLRAWMLPEGGQMVVHPGVFDEPGAWGIVLADVLEHVCGAYEHYHGLDPNQTKFEVLRLFMAEIGAPTGNASGEALDG